MSGQVADVIRFPVERRRPRRLIPLRELQERFGFSERWWRYRMKEGLPRHKWSGGVRFDPDEVEQWMEARYGEQAG
jgi:predicted DNA-binding transcriptional regulator AlpA